MKIRHKLVYLFVVLALAIGLVPGLSALAGEATITVYLDSSPPYKVGEPVNFSCYLDPDGDSVDWYVDGTLEETDTNVGNLEWAFFTWTFTSDGPHTVSATGHWAAVEQTDAVALVVGEGLIPQVEWNVLAAEGEFRVPADYIGHVQLWEIDKGDGAGFVPPLPTVPAEGGNDVAGPPMYDFIVVQCVTAGEWQIKAITDLDVDQDGSNDILYGEKKWGKIWETEMLGWYDLDKDWWVDDGELLPTPGSTQVIWSEYDKAWYGWALIADQVTGAFPVQVAPGVDVWMEHPADGAIVHWYLFDASLDIIPLNRLDDGATLKAELDALLAAGWGARWVQFNNGGQYEQTVSGDWGEEGLTGVNIWASAEESVRIIALVDYPTPMGEAPEHLVRPEFFSWNFWTQEMEKVPQVRWAGEKIVLEKYWGVEFYQDPYYEYIVHYSIENESPGTLETVTPLMYNLDNDSTSVWTPIQEDGTSKVILMSEKPGEVDVTAALYQFDRYYYPYDIGGGWLINQHGFVVYYLKFYSLELTKVVGERTDHNDGLWVPENPWDNSWYPVGNDTTSLDANVSADDLLRVRVKGWFMGDDLSIREPYLVDVNHNGVPDMYDYWAPAGHWVLPDDWEYLVGMQWNEFRPNWDIMDQPDDDVVTYNYDWQSGGLRGLAQGTIVDTDPLGPYGYVVSHTPTGLPIYEQLAGAVDPWNGGYDWWAVIGPYSSLDDGIADGREQPQASWEFPGVHELRDTIVPNGALNWWDCPMPPAKVTFEIQSGPGYFKAVNKADVYYRLVDAHDIDPSVAPGWAWVIQYTNPFYAIEIPASSEIPPFVNNGGYDWDSWDWTVDMGPYFFWDIVNQIPYGIPNGASMPDDPTHPTKVQVYSDNHGEAMVWLNGDWNLDLSAWVSSDGYYDIPYGQWLEVNPDGSINTDNITTVQAYADYPYLRKHAVIASGEVTDYWNWGKSIILLIEQGYVNKTGGPGGGPLADPNVKIVWALVADRDEFPVYGEAVQWHIDTGMIEAWLQSNGSFSTDNTDGDEGRYGWYNGLAGWIDVNSLHATTWTREPTQAEIDYLLLLFGIDASNYGITALKVWCSGGGVDLKIEFDERVRPDGSEGEGLIVRQAVSTNTNYPDKLDFDQYRLYFPPPDMDALDPVEDLTAGWNLIVYTGSTTSVANAIQTISGNVLSVWSFDNQTKLWGGYSPSVPAWASDLTTMNQATAYWIEVSADCTWSY